MKTGGPYRSYPAILSQIRNPPVLIRKFHSGIFFHVVRNFFRLDLSASSGERERNFCDGIFRIPRKSQILTRTGPRCGKLVIATGIDPPTKEPSVANLTTRLLFRNWWRGKRFQSGTSVSGQEDFVSGRVLRDRYDKVLRPSL
jgi:hypothetical protein